MKKKSACLLFLLGGGADFPAPSSVATGLPVEDARLTVRDGRMVAELTLRLDSMRVRSSSAVLLQPVLCNGTDTLRLAPVGVYGRSRHYQYVRNRQELPSSEDRSWSAARRPMTYAYREEVAYQPWMDGARLLVERREYGCCSCLLSESQEVTAAVYRVPEPAVFRPRFVYVTPPAEAHKTRSFSAAARVEFPVNGTVILPAYRNNPVELRRIVAAVDSVCQDADVRITALTLKGYASPEGTYAANSRLAEARTEAVRDYLLKREGGKALPDIQTDYEPENWEGLRAYVAASGWPAAAGLLAVIDSPETPDRKEARLRREFPVEYKRLLSDCYPSLRQTAYTVAYEVREFTDVEHIKRLLREAPQKLSLREFYLAAQSLEPGSPDYQEVFETAVRMFPQDTVANLNAANAAMSQGKTEQAARYLEKAGVSPEADYARGVCAALSGEYIRAERFFMSAQPGCPAAASALEELRRVHPQKQD